MAQGNWGWKTNQGYHERNNDSVQIPFSVGKNEKEELNNVILGVNRLA